MIETIIYGWPIRKSVLQLPKYDFFLARLVKLNWHIFATIENYELVLNVIEQKHNNV